MLMLSNDASRTRLRCVRYTVYSRDPGRVVPDQVSRLEKTLNNPRVVLVAGMVAVALNILLYFGVFLPRMTPLIEHVVRVPRAIPQYEIGHSARVGRITAAMDALPGLSITGNALRGVAFADAASDGVRIGRLAARRLIEPAPL